MRVVSHLFSLRLHGDESRHEGRAMTNPFDNSRASRADRRKRNLRYAGVQLLIYSSTIAVAVAVIVLIVRWI